MKKYQLLDEVLAYVTAESSTNTDERNLVAGSRNVLIDQQRKVRTRNGYSRIGVANETVTPVRNAVTWNTSTGTELMLRAYDDELEVYLGTVGDTEVNAWTRVEDGWSTTITPRFTTFYDATEGIDELIFVYGDDNLYEWNGAVAVVSSITATTITKTGTNTFAQDRFYAAANKVVVCVRTGTEYTYTGGESTTTLTGIADTTGLVAGDILVQKVVTASNTPVADRKNHTIFTYENHVCVGSNDNNTVYVSKNTDYASYTYSTPRVPGEGALLTLDGNVNGFATINEKLIVFSGKSSIFQASFTELTVGSTKTEALDVKKYQVGVNQSAQSQETIVQIGNSVLYLSFEPAVRELLSLEEISGGKKPTTLSNPIKPDFDAEDWTDACAVWFKNAMYLSAPESGVVYILEYKEDADGQVRRFWQAPQTMPVRPFTPYDGKLYGHSNGVPESYYLFDPDAFSDVNSSDEKVSIRCVAKFAYRNFGDRANLKTFDEYFVEGEISPATTITVTLYYDFGGNTLSVEDEIGGSDMSILEETLLNVSLGQQPLGQDPLGGSVNSPTGTAKFRAIIEKAREDFFEMQEIFETDDTDKYWAIIARGPNVILSTKQPAHKKI